MSWKSIACIAALGAVAAPAMALPSINVIDNGSGSGSITITTTSVGSIGAEIALTLSGATLTSAAINSAIFDTANPGDSPFIAGSPVGGDATGLNVDTANKRLFAAYGSGSQPAGTYKLLDFVYGGTGTATASGLVASVAVTTSGLTKMINIGTPTLKPGDTNGDGKIDGTDLAAVGQNWDPSGAKAPHTRAQGDLVVDNKIDGSDLAQVGANWNPTGAASAVAVPEPASLAVALVGLLGLAGRRK